MPKRSSKNPTPGQDPANAEQPASEPTDTPALADSSPPAEGKNPAAVALGRLGGKKGGDARSKKLTKEQRSAIAKKAAAARWNKGG